ncbi:MAG: phage tail family protein [Symbiobacteriaceae bacterium]
MSGFRYNGVHSSTYGMNVLAVRRGILPPITAQLLEVPGRPGGYYQGRQLGTRTIAVDVQLVARDYADLRSKVRSIAAWLQPGTEPRDLVFDDEPGLTWRAVLSGSTDLDEIVAVGKGTLQFLCPDPVALGDEHVLSLGVGGEAVVTAGGTAPAWPVIRATVQQPITYLTVATPDRYVLLGRPEAVEETPAERETMVLHDTCASLAGWGPATEVLNGIATGTMTTNGAAFYPSDYGSGSGWHGPAIKRSIPQAPLQDFRVDVLVSQHNLTGQTGRAEVYLLDENGVIVGMISVRDRWESEKRVEARALMGNAAGQKDIWVGQAAVPHHWNQFDGIMRLERVGTTWVAYWAKIDQTGRHHTRKYVRVVDEARAFQAPIAQVVVWLSKYANTQNTNQSISDIKIWRINNMAPTQVPYIAMPGDVVEIDCERHAVYLNGEPRLDLLDPTSQFFSLPPGQPVTVGVEPAGAVTGVELAYRERWL